MNSITIYLPYFILATILFVVLVAAYLTSYTKIVISFAVLFIFLAFFSFKEGLGLPTVTDQELEDNPWFLMAAVPGEGEDSVNFIAFFPHSNKKKFYTLQFANDEEALEWNKARQQLLQGNLIRGGKGEDARPPLGDGITTGGGSQFKFTIIEDRK